jgi:hypothetical protein
MNLLKGRPFPEGRLFFCPHALAGALPPQFLDFSDPGLSLHWATRYGLSYQVEREHQ